MGFGDLAMDLFRVTLRTEIVVIADNETDAIIQAEFYQTDVAMNQEFHAEKPKRIVSSRDALPPYWDKHAVPWNGNTTIETILKGS